MIYEGLLEFLTELQPGHELAAWELERVEQLHVDDDGNMRFAVTISLGELSYRLTSYIPPRMVLRDIEQTIALHFK